VTDGAIKLLLQTFAIMGKSINQFELRDADVVLRPVLVGVSSSDFTSRVRAIRAGREAALAALPQLKGKMSAWPR
jgi:NTE family protein